MLINNTIRISVAMAAFLSLASLPANADESTTTTTTTYGGDSSGPNSSSVTTSKTVTTTTEPSASIVTTPSNVVYFRTASPEVLVTTLAGRRKSLAEQIDQACDRGEITGNKAEAMKRELSRIDRESNSTISYSRAVMFAQDLDLIGDQYRTIVKTTPSEYVPIISGSRFTVSSGQVLQLDDLSVRRADLEGRVLKDLLQGRMSESQASKLRAKLESLGNEQAIYSENGNLNDKEARHLYNEFDRVASDIERIAGKDND